MCRLFGMNAGGRAVAATFWLLEAPDSLAVQSRREPDGTGLGWFGSDGVPRVDKQPLAAFRDAAFAREARERLSSTFLAHIRFASTGGLVMANTHPFEQAGRLFAHNGVIGDLPRFESRLGAWRALVAGDTDSERFFALVTKETSARGGDVSAGITAAVRWIAQELPVFALNLVLAARGELWALRYPDTHELFVLERAAGGVTGRRHLEHASAAGTVRVRSAALAGAPAVVVASERMDEDPGWRPLASGELLHVSRTLQCRRAHILPEPPRHPLTLADLDPRAAASQAPAPETSPPPPMG